VKMLLVLIILAALAWMGLRRFETMNLYYPIRELMATPAQVGMPYEEVNLTTSDNVAVHGWWIPNPKKTPDIQTILFSHGNGGNISHRLDRAQRLLAAGANVFLLEYRGYGKSAGVPSEPGMYQDAAAAYRFLTEDKKVPPQRIVLYGESLGGAIAVETALHHPVGGVILDSTFPSAVEVANLYFPWLPARLIMRYPHDSLSKIKNVHTPILSLHSPQDDIIPYALGRKLFAAANEPKQFVNLIGDHNEGYIDTGDAYIQAISVFLKGLK